MAERLNRVGSMSSVYLSEEESEGMEFESGARDLQVILGKRKCSGRVMREEDSSTGCEETDGDRAKVKRTGSGDERRRRMEREELERMREVMKRREESEERKVRQEKREKELEMRKKEKEEEERRVKDSERKEVEEEDNCDRITVVQRELRKIVKAVERENGGKIAFTRGDQAAVREAVFNIQNEVVEIMKCQIRMERRAAEAGKRQAEANERGVSVRKVDRSRRVVSEDAETSASGEWKAVQERRKRRTYAQVSASKSGRNGEDRIEGRVVVAGKEGWRTPPLRRATEEEAIVVRSGEERNARRLAETLAKNISVKDIGGAPRVVRRIRDGKVVIVPKDKDQGDKIVGKLGQIKSLEIRKSKAAEPLLVVSGVTKGMDDLELEGKIKRGMSMNEGEVGGVKIVRRVPCRNPWKENVIIKMDMANFKAVVKRGKMEIDCTLHYVEEYLGIAMCYRCWRFGHVIKYCKEAEVCHKCGGGHDGRECKKEGRRCINCFRMYGKVSEHSARDNICPAMREILEKSRRNINYH